MNKLVKKSAWIISAVILTVALFSFANTKPAASKPLPAACKISVNKSYLYDSLHLNNSGLSRQAFSYALKGYNYLLSLGKIKNDETVSIIDFSLPSYAKRLFVVDVKKGIVLFNTYVSHGRNSGKEVAGKFSNEPESFESSLGFYITSDTYNGKHGYSLRLEGEEAGINDNAFSRGIVMHSAPYVNERLIQKQGYIGRSEGCPAVPEKLYKPIIEKIKNGSCLFMYSPDKNYMTHSQIINNGALV